MPFTSSPKIDIQDIAARLWETADELRANSHLKAAEYSIPVLGLIFLKFADSRFTALEQEFAGKASQSNTYYENPWNAVGEFDYVMANPPFNVNKIDKAKLRTSTARSSSSRTRTWSTKITWRDGFKAIVVLLRVRLSG